MQAAAEPSPDIKAEDPLAPEPPPSTDDTGAGADMRGVVGALQDELDKAKDQAMRALAEAENTRRRAAREREDATKYSIARFAKDLLDVSDNLRRALEAVPEDLLESEPRLKNLVDGIEATERTLLKAFDTHGIKKLEPLDEPFDPNFHEVMFEAPVPGKPAGTVMQVIETGYILHDRLLRPARVGISKDDGTQGGGNTPPHPGGHIDTQA
ncbi:MAG: nucleotide exchange factor GrpE [Alphaproteobacteria bacterium]|nr:nucleotide exchange factor GrpE [Alphaproteobacteria bacterium]